MKSKKPKIQILLKGIIAILVFMLLTTPAIFATSSLDDNTSIIDKIMHGEAGSKAKQIEEFFKTNTTLGIRNEAELRALAEYVNSGHSCAGKTIKLLSNIEVSIDEEWVPIGKNGTTHFQGIFDGNNYTISGVTYLKEGKSYDDLCFIGLFGVIGTNGIVKNLTTNKFSIDILYDDGDIIDAEGTTGSINMTYYSTGNIAGYNYGKIDNCVNKSNVSGANNVGGIAGVNKGTIQNSINQAVIRGYDYVGGITGDTKGKIINCSNSGSIVGHGCLGGIAGVAINGGSIEKCTNGANIIVSDGLSNDIGGIVGKTEVEIKDCKNTANINGGYKGTDTKPNYASYIGGIAGITINSGVINNSYNSGDITGWNCVGGITGGNPNNSTTIIANGCINIGTVVALEEETTNVGGITGISTNLVNDNCKTYTPEEAANASINSNNYGASFVEQGLTAEFGDSNVTYKISKNNTKLSEKQGYFKSGDIIKITATFDRYLATVYGPLTSVDTNNAPKLKLNNTIDMTTHEVAIEEYTTTITYIYQIKDGENINISTLNLINDQTIYLVSGDDYTTNHPTVAPTTIATAVSSDIVIDTQRPLITTNVYVDNELETGRYSAGKEVMIELKTTEEIADNYITPEIQVSFGKSGIGKYNYNSTNGNVKVGYAKCKDASIQLDGTTKWIYSYIIQEGDEGQVSIKPVAGSITDLSGNVVEIKSLFEAQDKVINENDKITGAEWSTDINVSLKYYLNDLQNEIAGGAYLNKTDKLFVVAEFDKVLYVNAGNNNGVVLQQRLNNTYKDNSPSIYLNGDINLKGEVTKVTTKDAIKDAEGNITTSGKTEITYELIMENYSSYVKDLLKINNAILKNENNAGKELTKGTETVTTSVRIAFTDEYYASYDTDTNVQNYKYINEKEIKTNDAIDNLYIDPLGSAEAIAVTSEIYADTTAPKVKIEVKNGENIVNSITNANELKYIFTWSEKVVGFNIDDVIVNGGSIKETQMPAVVENEDGTYSYVLTINSNTHIGNIENLQVIVEDGAVVDEAAKQNVRYESVIVIDKKAPELQIIPGEKMENGRVYTFKFNEAIKNFDITDIKLNGEALTEESGTLVGQGAEYKLTLNTLDTSGQIITVENGVCTDIAGNDNVKTEINTDKVAPILTITAKDNESQNVNTSTNVSELEYTFAWSEEVEEFTIDDITINGGTAQGTLTKVENSDIEYTVKINANTVNGNNGNIQIIVEADKCKDLSGNSNARTEKVIMIDKKAAILMSLEAYMQSNIKLNENVDIVKENYKANEEVKVIATFDENIVLLDENITGFPKLALQFSESGNAKGSIKDVSLNGNKIIYTYAITKGDQGTLSVRGFTGIVVDVTGNQTQVTKRILDGNTVIADTIAPKLEKLEVLTSEGKYKANTQIEIQAVYDENVYSLKENEIQNVTSDTAPELKLQFGGKDAKGTVRFKKYADNDKTKLIYNYTITGEEAEGDNGDLVITAYNNKTNTVICDIAGNEASDTVNQEGKVTADTIRPKVTNITASVENPIIKDAAPYYKADNKVKIVLTFDENVSGKVLLPKILVGFSESNNAEPTSYNEYSYESDWNVNSTTIEYTYKIKAGDNGYLWVKVPENQYADEAGNGNPEKLSQKLTSVYADTILPHNTTNVGEESALKVENIIQNGITTALKVTAEYSEDMYAMDNQNNRVNISNNSDYIPVVGMFIENSSREKKLEKTQKLTTTSKNVLATTISITDIDLDDGEVISVNLISGTLCDRAGNVWSLEQQIGDVSAPVFKNIKFNTADGYYKEGTNIEILGIFKEETKIETAPKLKIKIGDKIQELNPIINREDILNTDTEKVVRYNYSVVNGDNNPVEIVSLIGFASDGVRSKEVNKIYLAQNEEEVTGVANEIINYIGSTYGNKVITDTTKPYVTSIIAKANDQQISIYTKEEGKDAVVTVGKTNANIVEYTVKYSEPIPSNHFDRIQIINGIIKDIKYTTEINPDEYKITVQTLGEGVQSLILPDGTAEDRAGNQDNFLRMDSVIIDMTPATVRFISEYNGGIYILPTTIGKIEVRPNIEINEDIQKVEYKWNDENEYANINNYSSSSDISIPSKTFNEARENTLYVRVIDIAGNITETSKLFEIQNANIDIVENTYEDTNKDITLTVTFEEGLTDNRKVTFKEDGTEQVVELNAIGTDDNGNTQYAISKNGVVYAEATDRVGNKVFTESLISNIDKDKPIVELDINGGNIVIGTGKDKAIIKTKINTEDKNLKDIKYAFTTVNVEIPYDMTAEQLKSNLEIQFLDLENYKEAKIDSATTGIYYLYVIATDTARNETLYKSNEFNVANSNILKDADGEVIFNPSNADMITFEQKEKTVYTNLGSNLLSETETINLTEKEDGYCFDEYAEILKPTIVTAKASDICGNEVIGTYEVKSVTGPEFTVTGNAENWTNQDIKLEVSCYEELSALTVNNTNILSTDKNVISNIVIKENGTYKFVATDQYGNTSEKDVEVTKIDKVSPIITKAETEGKSVTITATDELSELKEYSVTTTTEVPVEWSDSNTIKTTKDGIFYVWAKDKAGNVARADNSIIIDTTVPTIAFNYNSTIVTVKSDLKVSIMTNEEAKISYSWDNENWTTSEEYIESQIVEKTINEAGKYTLYAKATDKFGNESKAQCIEITGVGTNESIVSPEIIFEDIPIIQVQQDKYAKTCIGMTPEILTSKMNKKALLGEIPEYKNLTEDGKLKTGSEIVLNGETKYVIVINGDVNCDGKVSPIDVTMANSIRLEKAIVSEIQKLAADFDSSNAIKPIDVTMINSYRLGKITISI